MQIRRSLRTAVGCTTAAFLMLLATPALAHNDTGMVSIASTPLDAQTVEFLITVVFEGDGHLAPAAVVTAVATSADTTIGPVEVPASGEEGIYKTTIDLAPGDWELRFTSLNPQAFATIDLAIPAEGVTTTPPEPTGAGTPTDGGVVEQSAPTPSTTTSRTPLIAGAAALGILLTVLVALILSLRRCRVTRP